MENKKVAIETKTEEFSFKNHALNALIAALYYLIVYIPFILPFRIWGKAATRLNEIWLTKSIAYNEKEKEYPLWAFYFFYLINFIFDAVMFLIWPLGFIYLTYKFFDNGVYEFLSIVMGYLVPLYAAYASVIVIRLVKEILFFFLNNLVVWFLEVLKNIGTLIKNLWLLNFVIKKKE